MKPILLDYENIYMSMYVVIVYDTLQTLAMAE